MALLRFQASDHPRDQVRVPHLRQGVHQPEVPGHTQAGEARHDQGVEHASATAATTTATPSAATAATTAAAAGSDDRGTPDAARAAGLC